MSQSHSSSDPGASDNNQTSEGEFIIHPNSNLMGSWTLGQQQHHPNAPSSMQRLWDAVTDPLWQQNMNWTSRNAGGDDFVPENPTLAQLELFRLAPGAPASQTLPHFHYEQLQRRNTPMGLSEGEEHPADNKSWPNPNPSQDAMEWYRAQASLTPDAARYRAQRHSPQPRAEREVKIPQASQKDEIAALLQEEAEKPFKCPDCPARFARKRDCERHRRSVHTGSKAYHCKGCGEGFVRSDGRGRHWKLSPECRLSHVQLTSSRSSPST